METKREQQAVGVAAGPRQALPLEPGVRPGSVDVVGVVPADVRVDPYITEGHPGYNETAPSEIISAQRLAAATPAKVAETSQPAAGAGKAAAAKVTVTLTSRECDYLARLIDRAFGEARVEARRTHYNLDYRQAVLEEEQLLRGLMDKFRQPTS